MTWKSHFDFWCYIIALMASTNYSIFLAMACCRFKNTYLTYFSIAYSATTLMLISNFVDYYFFHFSGKQIEWIHIPLMLCMAAILFSVTTLFYLLLQEIIPVKVLTALRFSSVIPLVYLSATLFMDRETLVLLFSVVSIAFYVILGLGCILFGRAIDQLTVAFKKLARNVWIILSICVLIFITHGVFNLQFNPLVIFYIMLNVALTRYVWNRWGKKLGGGSAESKMQDYSLTDREREIVALIILGKTNKSIGERLYISDKTVKNHIYNIYKKLGIKSRFELMSLFSNER